MTVHVPNEESARRLFVKTEAVRGTAVIPDRRLIAELGITPSNAALVRTEEATGGFDRLVTPRRGNIEYGGNLGAPMTFQNGPQFMRWLLKGGGTPSTSSGGAYTYLKTPSFDVDDIDSFTAYYGVPGLAMYSRGVMLNEGTISMDLDNADGSWQFSGTAVAANQDPLPGGFDGVATGGTTTTIVMTGAGWTVDALIGGYVFLDHGTPNAITRQIVDNTATELTLSAPLTAPVAAGRTFRIAGLFPAGVPVPAGHAIPTETTDVFVDPAGNIGETVVNGRMIMASLTIQNNRYMKTFMGSDRTKNTGRSGRRARVVTGQLRVEFDQWYEYDRWKAMDKLAIRFKSEGDLIASSGIRELAQIDVLNAVLDEETSDTREANLTKTVGFVGYVVDTDPICDTRWINDVATLA